MTRLERQGTPRGRRALSGTGARTLLDERGDRSPWRCSDQLRGEWRLPLFSGLDTFACAHWGAASRNPRRPVGAGRPKPRHYISARLSAAAQAVLAGLPRHEHNPHILPGRRVDKPKSALMKPWTIVRKAAGLDGVRLHDLRDSFASVGAGSSMGLPIIGKLLGHFQPSTTARYAHLDADPMRRAAETIGTPIDAAMNRKPR
jgi:integrase